MNPSHTLQPMPPAGVGQPRARESRGLRRRVERVRLQLAEWRTNARSRRELAALDSRQLHDIGLAPGDAAAEIGKPFWRR